MARDKFQTDNEPPLYFPDDAQKYLELNIPENLCGGCFETIKPDQIVPMIEFSPNFFPYFSYHVEDRT